MLWELDLEEKEQTAFIKMNNNNNYTLNNGEKLAKRNWKCGRQSVPLELLPAFKLPTEQQQQQIWRRPKTKEKKQPEITVMTKFKHPIFGMFIVSKPVVC